MVSLVDIVPQTRTVEIAGGEIELRGLGLRQIGDLLVRFPELRKIIARDGPDLDYDAVIMSMPDAVAAIIAAAARRPDIEETIAAEMPLGDAFGLLEPVWELTFPRGIPPFLLQLMAAGRANGADRSGTAADMSSPNSPNGSSPPDMLAAK